MHIIYVNLCCWMVINYLYSKLLGGNCRFGLNVWMLWDGECRNLIGWMDLFSWERSYGNWVLIIKSWIYGCNFKLWYDWYNESKQ